MAAAARMTMAMDGTALRSFGVPVDGMDGSTVSKVLSLNGEVWGVRVGVIV